MNCITLKNGETLLLGLREARVMYLLKMTDKYK